MTREQGGMTLSVQRRARDLVNASMRNASSSAETSRLTNSEPLSVWKPCSVKGNARGDRAVVGQCSRFHASARAANTPRSAAQSP